MKKRKQFKHIVKDYVKRQATQNRLIAKCAAEALYLKLQWKGDLPGNDILEAIDSFVSKEKQEDKQYMRKLKKEMLFSRLYYQTINKDFFLFAFEDKSDYGRKKYVGWLEQKEIFRKLAPFGRIDIIDSKDKVYDFFKDYYHRDVLLIQNTSQREEFLRFVIQHKPCVLKPLDQFGGKGIKWIDVPNEVAAEKVYEECSQSIPFLLEERIIQDNEMAKFHPQSVNTIRYNTFFHENQLTRLQAIIRMGKGDSYVDNASSGGIYAPIDIESGIICGPARSFSNEMYLFHPTTGEQIVGSRIPKWDELNYLLEKIVRVIPQQKQVGWDFALSTKGWVLVETNSHPAIQSFDLDHGMREQIADAFGQVVPVRRY